MLVGQNLMNCAMCKYREQVLGFEAEVGLAQESHHHHVEGIGTDSPTQRSTILPMAMAIITIMATPTIMGTVMSMGTHTTMGTTMITVTAMAQGNTAIIIRPIPMQAIGMGRASAIRIIWRRPAMLAYLRDPEEIYRLSFETIRREAPVDRLPADMPTWRCGSSMPAA